MKSSIEIAQSVELKHMRQYMADLGLPEDEFEFYGKFTGKIRLELLDRLADKPDGKLILVTAMTPTKYGEGKTLTSIGLGQALAKIGRKGMVALREPSLGPVFGIKGGATGGGFSQVIPMEKINLHFNGDIHAITTAHNLLAAMLDNHILKENEKRIDITNVLWNRTMDMNDRSLRDIVIGLGGKANGIPRESGFVITAASEIMAILALATSREDLKRRLGEIVVAYDLDGKVVKASDIDANRAMAAILSEAIMPNLVQTLEHTPALVHAGPFANIAHGTSSVLGDRIALKLADYVITECGFAADLGFEKFVDIVCRQSGLWPSAVVVVATCRAIKHHGGVAEGEIGNENLDASKKGLANLETHVRNIRKFGLPVIVAINRFPFDTPAELALIKALCQELGVECEEHEAFAKGGDGAVKLA
ncbi:MAG: formate--tetrahydrofolate ligase, partial [Thermoanaerobaculia bacterium]|nr:formate--tetrahydrofolate ligase [Thermoanaerobaculia bacterium]